MKATKLSEFEVQTIRQSLAYAIASIERLPEPQQDSDLLEEMKGLHEALCPSERLRRFEWAGALARLTGNDDALRAVIAGVEA